MKSYTLASIYAAVLFSVTGTSVMAAEQPNILFMMSDDQAWNGLSVPMHPAIPWSKSVVETPNLEKLAGMRFSAAYAPASVCSPTRISLRLERVLQHCTGPRQQDQKQVTSSLSRVMSGKFHSTKQQSGSFTSRWLCDGALREVAYQWWWSCSQWV